MKYLKCNLFEINFGAGVIVCRVNPSFYDVNVFGFNSAKFDFTFQLSLPRKQKLLPKAWESDICFSANLGRWGGGQEGDNHTFMGLHMTGADCPFSAPKHLQE